jgi:hypothetical protein
MLSNGEACAIIKLFDAVGFGTILYVLREVRHVANGTISAIRKKIANWEGRISRFEKIYTPMLRGVRHVPLAHSS